MSNWISYFHPYLSAYILTTAVREMLFNPKLNLSLLWYSSLPSEQSPVRPYMIWLLLAHLSQCFHSHSCSFYFNALFLLVLKCIRNYCCPRDLAFNCYYLFLWTLPPSACTCEQTDIDAGTYTYTHTHSLSHSLIYKYKCNKSGMYPFIWA